MAPIITAGPFLDISFEGGFWVTKTILGTLVLATLVFRALLIGQQALKCGKEYEGYFAFAIGIWFAFQTLVNVGAAAGMVPTKGLTLPLISYGGSSLIIMAVAVSILLRIDFECRVDAPDSTQKSNNDSD